MIGTTEIVIIAGVILVLFGATAIPKFARSIGKARAELEKGMKEGRQEAARDLKTDKENQDKDKN